MALDGAVTLINRNDLGDGEVTTLDVVGPSSYANGGEAIPDGYLNLRVGSRVDDVSGWDDTGEVGQVTFDAANGTLKFLTPAGAEEANLADLSARTYRLTVRGR